MSSVCPRVCLCVPCVSRLAAPPGVFLPVPFLAFTFSGAIVIRRECDAASFTYTYPAGASG